MSLSSVETKKDPVEPHRWKDLNVYVYVYVTVAVMKTTVSLREDLYEILKKKYGPRGLSEAINAILAESLLKGETMFGTMPKTQLKDLRDHRDHA